MSKRLGVSVAAIVAGLGVFLIAQLAGAEPKVQVGVDGPTEVMAWYHVLIFSLVIALLAFGLAWFLDRFDTGRIFFTIIGVIVLAGSFIPFARLGLTGADLVWQALLHLVVGLVILTGYWATWPAPQAPSQT